jgi:hypothetical protein
MTPELVLPDAESAADLQTFLARARKLDDGAVVRLVGQGGVLAVYAAALHGPGTPTVLALRVLALAEPAAVDTTVPALSLVERFRHQDRLAGSNGGPPAHDSGSPVRLPVPPAEVPSAGSAGWAGLLPPRSGWSVQGVLDLRDLRRAARAGITEVAAGTPDLAGSAAVTRLRAAVWGRPLAGLADLPAGAAFAAEAFGFLGPDHPEHPGTPDDDTVSLHRAGRWWRLSTTRGHVLARPASEFS